MKYKYLLISLIFICLFNISVNSQLYFNSIAIDDNNNFLFNSIEKLAGRQYNKTLFYGSYNDGKLKNNAITFFPENLFYSKIDKKLYIHNKMGLYSYDYKENKIEQVKMFPNFVDKSEYVIFDLPDASLSPNFRYAVAKIAKSSVTADLYFYDFVDNTSDIVVEDVEINPGDPVCYWSKDSNYFIFQKNDKVYYFSVSDYKKDKLLNEDWRKIGEFNIKNTNWTEDNYLIWIENNIIYRSDPNQFFTRSIYKNYIRQGDVIGKVPIDFDPSIDTFNINYNSNKFLIVNNNQSIIYYSLTGNIKNNPYLQLNERMSYDYSHIFDNGEAIILINKIDKGRIVKNVYVIKKINEEFIFQSFNPIKLNGAEIYNISIDEDNNKFVINSSRGAFCYNLYDLSLDWVFSEEKIVNSIKIDNNEWLLGGEFISYKYFSNQNKSVPLFASSFEEAGYNNDKIVIKIKNKYFNINEISKTLSELVLNNNKFGNNIKNQSYRIVSRKINKGFYKDGIYLKDLYSGQLIEIIASPLIRYTLYQPEIKLNSLFYSRPLPEKYEIVLVFNCINSAEGIYQILSKLSYFNIKATFFINGTFMDINPEVTKEIAGFDFEVGNLFQYYINLTDNSFLIDKKFIRQGLSANEEKYYNLTGKNFDPIWHSPMYAFNESIIKYGNESGYKFISYNIDSLDWIGENNIVRNSVTIHPDKYMKNSQLINQILKKVAPGQIILISTGKNGVVRSDWLFNDLDLLISELIRSGYTFTTSGELMMKYRE